MLTTHECHEQVIEVCSEVRKLDIRRFEAQLDSVQGLVERMQSYAEAASRALVRVIEVFDVGPSVDPAQTLTTGAGVPVVDIAFISELHIRQRRDRIGRLGRCPDPWVVIAEAASLRQHILESMIRVENAMAVEMGVAARLERGEEIDVALATRAAYRLYIRSIDRIARRVDAGELGLVAALRLSATSVAKIIGRDVYEHLRVADRQQLRSLQRRIFAAVREPEDELATRRLWMDIQSSAELLGRIHDRAELIEHDCRLLAEVLRERELDAGLRARLRLLEGRDAQVDALLGDADCPEASLREALVELHDRLARHLGREPIAQPRDGVDMLAW